MKILNNLNNKNYNDLKKKLYCLYRELFDLKYKFFLKNLKNNNLIRLCKKKISLIKTIISIKNNEKNIKRYSNKKKII